MKETTKLYRIRDGFTLKFPDSPRVHTGGRIVELTADQYKAHQHKLEEPTADQVKAWRAEREGDRKRAAEIDQEADRRRREEREGQRQALLAQAAALGQQAA